MTKNPIIRSLIVLSVFTALCSAPAWGQERKTVINLNTAVSKALELSPEIRESRAKLLFAEAQKDEALANRWVQIEINGLAAPALDAEGDLLHPSSEFSSVDDIGLWLSADVLAVQPLYTFGRLSQMINAAKKNLEVEKAGIDLTADEVVLKTKEYYYGLLLALNSQELVTEALAMSQSALDRVKKQLTLEETSATEMDLYKLQSTIGMVEGLKAEADEGVALAQKALSAVCGLDDPAPFPAEERLEPVEMKLQDLAVYQEAAKSKRPELRQVKAGLEAMDSLVKAAEAERLPIIYLGGLFSVSWAPGREDLDNTFINDDYNHLYGGAGVGALWKFNFGIHQAKIDQAKAERLKIKAKELFAQTYLPLEVAQAYLAVQKTKKQIAATKKAFQNARRWFLAASSNYDLGLVESKEVNDSMLQYATQKAGYLKAVHDYNMSWAKLEKAAGMSQRPE